jgi:hypothetical protein|tara:strand:+ start:289 stop:546 length:258 start_codon:yes stop_codon:yes gene_type:complete
MLKKKDAQGFSIKVIVLAVIALIILVVLLGIFSGNIGKFIGTVKESQGCNEACKMKGYAGESSESGGEALIGARDSDGNQCYCNG